VEEENPRSDFDFLRQVGFGVALLSFFAEAAAV